MPSVIPNPKIWSCWFRLRFSRERFARPGELDSNEPLMWPPYASPVSRNFGLKPRRLEIGRDELKDSNRKDENARGNVTLTPEDFNPKRNISLRSTVTLTEPELFTARSAC